MEENIMNQIKQKPFKSVLNVNQHELELRLTQPQDSERFFFIIMKNQQYFSKTLTWANNFKVLNDAISYLNLMQQAHVNFEKITYFIWEQDQIIGFVGLILRLQNKEADIGYWLDEDKSGKGIITNCVKSVIDYGFQDLKLERLFIKCIASNIKSANVAIRLEFTEQESEKNSFQLENVWHDVRVFQMTKDNYSKTRQQLKND